MHRLHDLGRRDGPCLREALQNRRQTIEVVGVSVGDIDRREVPGARSDPIQQGLRLVDREEGVDEHGVPLAADERRRVRHPRQRFLDQKET